ncbi:MAG: type II toxin-antitoxin system VapC family toxin [Planctomycetaceae bacterium]|nr:type II toxin-antitoxin system VapC family toxin [Planctomycetaceae bacterium]
MAVIDASVWVALFKGRDHFYQQAESILLFLDANQERICIPSIAFTEVAGVIRRVMHNRDAAWDAVRCMKKMVHEVFVNTAKLEPVATEIAINQSVRGADAYYLAVAKLKKSKLYTFDTHQEEAFEAISQNW